MDIIWSRFLLAVALLKNENAIAVSLFNSKNECKLHLDDSSCARQFSLRCSESSKHRLCRRLEIIAIARQSFEILTARPQTGMARKATQPAFRRFLLELFVCGSARSRVERTFTLGNVSRETVNRALAPRPWRAARKQSEWLAACLIS
jgi:hypothetical protein